MKTKIYGKLLLIATFLFLSTAICPPFSGAASDMTHQKIRDRYYKSYDYEILQDYENAVKVIIPIFEKYPKGYMVNLRLGWLYYLKRSYADSIYHYKIAGATAPYSIEARLGYLLPLMVQKKYDKAEIALSQILSVDQNNYYANLKLVMIYRLGKKLALAEKIAKKMLTLYPIDPFFLSALKLTTPNNGKKKETALMSWNIRDRYYKSFNYEKLQDYDNAVKVMIPVFETYPKDYMANLRLGRLYYLKRSYANSIRHYKIAAAAAPYSIEARLGYLTPLMVQKKYDKAETVLSQILIVDQNNYYANLKLAMIYRLGKKLDLAEKTAKRMLALYPIDVSFMAELGLTMLDNGKKKEAAAMFMDIKIINGRQLF